MLAFEITGLEPFLRTNSQSFSRYLENIESLSLFRRFSNDCFIAQRKCGITGNFFETKSLFFLRKYRITIVSWSTIAEEIRRNFRCLDAFSSSIIIFCLFPHLWIRVRRMVTTLVRLSARKTLCYRINIATAEVIHN